ncbi:MAG: AAA family ATPase [Bacillota bacterium]
MELHMLCGIPGSGKSTIVKNLPGFVVSTDSIRKFLWDDEAVVKHDKLVFEMAESMMKYMLNIGSDVIFDATNLTIEKRMKYILMAKTFEANVTVHWVNCPIKVAISRNVKRDRKVPVPMLKALYNSLQPPSTSEGMDKIIIYQQDLSVGEVITTSQDS